MKMWSQIIKTLIYLILLCSVSIAQVIEGDVVLSSQDEVDSFSAAYITGNLTNSGADIVDLTSLSLLDSVGGYLSIYDNDVLTNLDGLSNLTFVGGSLNLGFDVPGGRTGSYIQGNNSLSTLNGLSNLSTVGVNLNIKGNKVLTNLDGLHGLVSVGGDLVIAGNVKLVLYNVFGQKIVVLTDGFRQAGYHEITFDASVLASGVYYYTLNTGSFTDIKKMVLIK